MTYDHIPVTVDGKSAVVIGGTSGLGKAIAVGFAADGADVIATSRDKTKVTETAEQIKSHGAKTAEITCDVTDNTSLEMLCDEAVETLGDVDILVNSAGVLRTAPVVDMDDGEWSSTLDVMLDGIFRSCRIFGRTMESGSIINISSINAQLSREHLGAYCAAKGGVESFTRVLAKELGPSIRVNVIAPGVFLTPLTADAYTEGSDRRQEVIESTLLDRIGQPEEITGAAIYLGSDAASYTTGEVLTVDAGMARNR
jgi:NAD(P)-dependent dehydrogenase (short-subunit alcohol dehydrogenase family)